jgi:hypothetical protein
MVKHRRGKIFDKVRASSRLENGARRPEQSPIES